MVVKELKELAGMVWPLFLTNLILYSRSSISMHFLGRIGDNELAAGSLSIAIANITGYSVLKGLAAGMEPICCQAYGAKKWELLSQTCRKVLSLLLLVSVPIALSWLNMGTILKWFTGDEKLTSLAMTYLTYSIPELLMQALLYPLRILLKTQNINGPLTISALCAMFLHYPINWFLANYLNLGEKGVALASTCFLLNINVGLLVYLFYSQRAIKPWDGITNRRSKGWRKLISLAIPSVGQVCIEWWYYELMLLMCGLLSNKKVNVAAMGILIQTTSLLYTFPNSLSAGLSTHIGHKLGADQPLEAKQTTIVGLIISLVWGLLAFVFTILVKNVWGKLFTSDGQILAATLIALPILGFCELGNSPQTAACGILVGSARPKEGLCINFGSFYLIGLPVSLLLGHYFKMGFRGLWLGLAAAQFSCMSMMIYTLARTEWEDQAKRAKDLTQATEGQRNGLETNLLDEHEDEYVNSDNII